MLAEKNKLIILETTVPSFKHAKNIAQLAIGKKLAACVHISKIKSIYRWKEKLEKTDEIKLVFKTVKGKGKALYEFVSKHHPYTVPEILVFKVNVSSKEYTKWVTDETKNT